MSDGKSWEAVNAEYLRAAIAWLRLRLERLAPPPLRPTAAAAAPETAEEAKSVWTRFRRPGAATSSGGDVRLLLPPADEAAVLGADIDTLAKQMADAEAAELPPPLVLLARRLGLSKFEQHLLLLCLAMELDTDVARLCARAQDDLSRGYPTFALAFALFDDPAWAALSPEGPLRYFRLLEISQPGAQPLTTSALRVDERVLNFVKGLNYLDDRLAHLVSAVPARSEREHPPSQQRAIDTIVRVVTTTTAGPRLPPVIRLSGTDPAGKRDVAAVAAAALGAHLYKLPADLIPTHAGELESIARLWQREALLLPLSLYIEAPAREKAGTDGTVAPAQRLARRTGGLVFVDVRSPASAPQEGAVTVDVGKPTAEEQRTTWTSLVGEASADAPSRLAGQFDLNLSDIREIAAAAMVPSAEGGEVRSRLWQACLARTRPDLDTLAEPLAPKATWNDIVLPATESALLRQIASQVAGRTRVYDDWGFRAKMNRGLGITALFAGDSGTGKTMAAEVLANDLALNLYRVDLSAVVSKYIGETEKNLRQVFDAAEDGGAILFFDEADALFGKRSEVKDSHDRYANIEVNYLLQRMESYRGLAILATNMKSALDSAFMRRLRFIVNFAYPGPAERRAIWEKVFPDRVPTRGLDLDRLAKLNLTGGNIHSVALAAAFLAVQADTPVTMPLVLDAARTEFRKLDWPINEADLRWVDPGGVAA